MGMGSPKKTLDRENLKFGLKFSVLCYPHKTFSIRRASRQGSLRWYNFWKVGPLKFGRAKKTSKIHRDFWQLSNLITNISGMTPDIQNLKEMWSTAIPPHSMKENPVNFGPQTKKFYWLTLSHPSGYFWGDYISAPRGCCALIFIHALEIVQALIDSAHPKWDGGPHKF